MINITKNNAIQFNYSIANRKLHHSGTPLENCRITTCRIVTLDSLGEVKDILGEGEAICHPLDNFVKEMGRKRSLEYAIKNANMSKEARKQIWEAYLNRPRTANS